MLDPWLPRECKEDNAEKRHQGLGIVTESWTRIQFSVSDITR